MARAQTVELTRADNFRRNLIRIFAVGRCQAKIARDAGLHPVHLAKIINGRAPNPTIGTIEALAVALEVPVEILLAASPSDADLRIFQNSG